ncbi:hypothetical protein MJ561_18790 [Klebsiella pneumoniae]|nr:hypothetical protein MJ561_18790 [Klebsiella pneumoniae]
MKTSAVPVENQVISAGGGILESQYRRVAGLCWVAGQRLRGGPSTGAKSERGMPNYINLCRHLRIIGPPFQNSAGDRWPTLALSGKSRQLFTSRLKRMMAACWRKCAMAILIFCVNGQTGELTLLVDEAELAARVSVLSSTSARRAWEPVGRCLGRVRSFGAEQGATCITF